MLNPRLRLEWLVSFLAVVDTGGFGAAAQATHRSQPRVSSHVAALERAVGIVLFDRSKRPVELTRAGTALALHARTVLRQIELAESDMAQWRDGSRGLVHLGCYPSASSAFVAPLLIQVAQLAPEIGVSLVERSTLELDQASMHGEIDLYLRPMQPPPPEGVRTHRLWREDTVLVAPDDHPLVSEAVVDVPIEIPALQGQPLISIGRIGEADLPSFETYASFRAANTVLEPVQATNQPQTLVSMVRAGLGLGVTNRLAVVMTDTSGVRLRQVRAAHDREVAVCWTEDTVPSPASATLLDIIRAAPLPAGTGAVAPSHSDS